MQLLKRHRIAKPWKEEGSYKDYEELLSLKNKEQERENKIEKDKEGGGLRQLLLTERERKTEKKEGTNGGRREGE